MLQVAQRAHLTIMDAEFTVLKPNKRSKPFVSTYQFAIFPSSFSDFTGSQTTTSSVTSAERKAAAHKTEVYSKKPTLISATKYTETTTKTISYGQLCYTCKNNPPKNCTFDVRNRKKKKKKKVR